MNLLNMWIPTTVEHRKSAPANKACPSIRHITYCLMWEFIVISILAIRQLHCKALFCLVPWNALYWSSTVYTSKKKIGKIQKLLQCSTIWNQSHSCGSKRFEDDYTFLKMQKNQRWICFGERIYQHASHNVVLVNLVYQSGWKRIA